MNKQKPVVVKPESDKPPEPIVLPSEVTQRILRVILQDEHCRDIVQAFIEGRQLVGPYDLSIAAVLVKRPEPVVSENGKAVA